MVWFGMFMLAPQVIYGLHGGMFGLSPHDLNVIHYMSNNVGWPG
jgi:hypothetical protein